MFCADFNMNNENRNNDLSWGCSPFMLLLISNNLHMYAFLCIAHRQENEEKTGTTA